MIAVECHAECGSIHSDGAVFAADCLSWKGGGVLQQRHALGQVAAPGEEGCKRFRWRHHEQFADLQGAGVQRDELLAGAPQRSEWPGRRKSGRK